jgi:hypothetical protein
LFIRHNTTTLKISFTLTVHIEFINFSGILLQVSAYEKPSSSRYALIDYYQQITANNLSQMLLFSYEELEILKTVNMKSCRLLKFTSVSEKHTASIFIVENVISKQVA